MSIIAVIKKKSMKLFSEVSAENVAADAVTSDLSVGVSQLARFMKVLKAKHFDAAIHVLQYLMNHLDIGTHYSKGNKDINVARYSDLDWAGNLLSSNLHLEMCLLCCKPIVWKAKLQTSAAVAEAEIVALGGVERIELRLTTVNKFLRLD